MDILIEALIFRMVVQVHEDGNFIVYLFWNQVD